MKGHTSPLFAVHSISCFIMKTLPYVGLLLDIDEIQKEALLGNSPLFFGGWSHLPTWTIIVTNLALNRMGFIDEFQRDR